MSTKGGHALLVPALLMFSFLRPLSPGTPGERGWGEGDFYFAKYLSPLTLALSPGVPGERGMRFGNLKEQWPG